MKYKIVVDKQSRTNPSEEKREYEIDIEELRVKGDVFDSLVITKDEAYVIRRLELSDFHVSSVLESPVREELQGLDLQLFEGDNYIYLIDMIGNHFYAEYLINNDFNDIYATRNEMNTVINQMADSIELSINQTLTGYATKQEMNASILASAEEISLEVSKKVDEDKVVSAINMSSEKIKLGTNRLEVDTPDFKLDGEGNMEAKSGEIGGFSLGEHEFSSNLSGLYEFTLEDAQLALNAIKGNITLSQEQKNLYDINENGEVDILDVVAIINIVNGTVANTKSVSGKIQINSLDPKNPISIKSDGGITTTFSIFGINTNYLSAQSAIYGYVFGNNFYGVSIDGQMQKLKVMSGENETTVTPTEVSSKNFNNISLAELKKNIEKLKSATDIVRNAEVYTYHYKTEKNSDKKHFGFVIGKKYKTPNEIKSNDKKAIDIYSSVGVLYKFAQELDTRLLNIETRIDKLEKEIKNGHNSV